jgi:hypothetical protein
MVLFSYFRFFLPFFDKLLQDFFQVALHPFNEYILLILKVLSFKKLLNFQHHFISVDLVKDGFLKYQAFIFECILELQ